MNIKLLVPVAALGLAGCATYGSPEAGRFDEADFGEANRMTFSAMVVDPDPQYDGPMEGDAERAVKGIEDYREGNVEEPEEVRSTETSGGS